MTNLPLKYIISLNTLVGVWGGGVKKAEHNTSARVQYVSDCQGILHDPSDPPEETVCL